MHKRKAKTRLFLTFGMVLALTMPLDSASAIFGFGDCKRLKTRVVNQDKIGRDYWNRYQDAVAEYSKLESLPYSYNRSRRINGQVQVIARLMIQVLRSDIAIYQDMLKHKKCLEDPKHIERVLGQGRVDLGFFGGSRPDPKGVYIKDYYSFNTDYYSDYVDASIHLKK